MIPLGHITGVDLIVLLIAVVSLVVSIYEAVMIRRSHHKTTNLHDLVEAIHNAVHHNDRHKDAHE